MIRIPSVSRPSRSREGRGQDTPRTDVPWWVTVFTDWGRPVTAIVVLVLCAPGEQHLADLSGWNETLSWGFAGLFSLYAGISAVVATVRPKGARGKRSAVAGAALSLLLAMAAQPVSHMFVTGWLTADPRPPLWLVITVSSVPPFILGHLLHLAASPVPFGQDVPKDTPVPSAVPSWVTEEKGRRAAAKVSRPSLPRDKTLSGTPKVSLVKDAPSRRPVPPSRPAVPSLGDRVSMSARALELVLAGDKDEQAVKDTLRDEFRDSEGRPPLANTVNKAVTRARDKMSRRVS